MGRSRLFQVEGAIQTATMLFWERGYEQTSLADLTHAMGITPPSFYFAFGSKDGLFRQVVEHYAGTYLAFMTEALAAPTSRAMAESILYGCADAYTSAGHPPGCLIVNNSMPCGNGSIEIRQELAAGRKRRFAELQKRLKHDKAAGDLPEDADPRDLARYLMSLRWGMAIEAQSGATRRDLHQIAARAMQAWPAP